MNPAGGSLHQAEKRRLRATLREAMRGISSENRSAAGEILCQRLVAQSIWRRATKILLYAPLETEPDIFGLFQKAAGDAKEFCLPRYRVESGDYMACRVADPGSECVVGMYEIREPGPSCPEVALKQLDLVLVPGVGFDLQGHRLGRGGGFYDRLLAQVPGIKCGVAFDEQVVESIPMEPHDVPLNCILTPTRWHEVVR